MQRGQTIETVSSPIYLQPGRGTVSSRDCTPLRVRGTARKRLRPTRRRYLTRCTASGGGLRECAVSATIYTGRRGKRRRRTLATGRVAMTGGSKRVRLRLNRYGRRVLRRHGRKGRRARLTFTVNDGDGASATARRTARLLRARKKKR